MPASPKKILVQQYPIDIEKISHEIGRDQDGAVILFVGRPRNHSGGLSVEFLTYEIFESMAVKEIEKIIDDSFLKWPITECIVVHRAGKVKIGEASIVIAVSSPHRQEAFDSVKYIIDTLKKTVPIWKTEHYSDGTSRVFDRS